MPLHHPSYFRYPFFSTVVRLLSGANCLVPPSPFSIKVKSLICPSEEPWLSEGWQMVPRKTWVVENFGRISKSRKRFWQVSKSLFLHGLLGLGFLTRISASQRVSDFTIRHPFSGIYYCFLCNSPGLTDCTTAGKIVDVTDKVRVQGSTTATSKEETLR